MTEVSLAISSMFMLSVVTTALLSWNDSGHAMTRSSP